MVEIERVSPLGAARVPGHHGAEVARTPGLVLSERHPLSMVQVESDSDGAARVIEAVAAAIGLAPPADPVGFVGDDALAIHWIGAHRWLAVAPATRDLEGPLRAGLAGTGAAVVDLSHGRTAFRLTGRMVREVLAKGTGIDLHHGAFAPKATAPTALFHVAVQIACLDDRPAFEIHAPRGFARSLWESLGDACAEYGYRVL